MSREQRIDLKTLRKGDKITVTFEVVEEADAHLDVSFDNNGNKYYFTRSLYGTVQRVPRPLAVKDRVTWPQICGEGAPMHGQILCIAGTQAWIENEYGNRFTAYLHELIRVD